MGLDLALGGLVLVMAIRGWFKGFVLQAVRLGGLILCVYAADPVRDQLKPRVMGHLPSIQPELLDRMLWWVSAVISYVVLVGLTTLAIKLYRRQPYGLGERHRGDQFAGSLFGMAKGVVAAACLVAGLERYGLEQIKAIPRAQEQVMTSHALLWTEKYRPVERVWASPPVQHFVQHVQRGGRGVNTPEVKTPAEATPTETAPAEPEGDPVQTASRTPKLQWSNSGGTGAGETAIDPEVIEAFREIEKAFERGKASK